MGMKASMEVRRGHQIPGAGVTDNGELLDVDAGNQTQGLCKCSTYTNS